MLQPHGRYFFGCLSKLPLVLETHLRREGVLSSNGFIYCIPEAAPTILRWLRHTFDVFVSWFLHPRCGNHWTIGLHLFGRVVFMLKMMITCKMKHLAIEIEDDWLNDDKVLFSNTCNLVHFEEFRQIPQDWSFEWYNLAAAGDTSIWIGAWESFEAWFCISWNYWNYGF